MWLKPLSQVWPLKPLYSIATMGPTHFTFDNARPISMATAPSIDALASAIVARFLRTNNYTETLQAFIREADLPVDAGQSSGDDTQNLTVQRLLEEKRAFDHSANFERYGDETKGNDGWTVPGETLMQSSLYQAAH